MTFLLVKYRPVILQMAVNLLASRFLVMSLRLCIFSTDTTEAMLYLHGAVSGISDAHTYLLIGEGSGQS